MSRKNRQCYHFFLANDILGLLILVDHSYLDLVQMFGSGIASAAAVEPLQQWKVLEARYSH